MTTESSTTQPNTMGTLYLIPVPLGTTPCESVLPLPVIETVRQLSHFVAENAKSARAFLKSARTTFPLQTISINELNEHTPRQALESLLSPLLAGNDVGLISEAGCPAVADPGSGLVDLAHTRGIRVSPMVGPSSLLLALMASGLGGQRFAFHGYLPAQGESRSKEIRQLEKSSRQEKQTQLFIETPYRNRAMFESLLATCQPSTKLCLASDLTLPSEIISTRTIHQWRKSTPPDIDRRPTVFLLLA